MFAPRDTRTLQAPFEIVSEHDPALGDIHGELAEHWQRYREGDKDALEKCVLDGKKPTVFGVKLIADNLLLGKIGGVMHRDGAPAAFIECACYTITDIDGWEGPFDRKRIGGHMRITNETRDALPFEAIAEIGAIALERSQSPNG